MMSISFTILVTVVWVNTSMMDLLKSCPNYFWKWHQVPSYMGWKKVLHSGAFFTCCQDIHFGEGNGTPLQYSCLENPMDGGAWWAAVHGVAKSWTWLSDFSFTSHFHALEKEMATHSSVLAWRIPGMGKAGGLPSMGLQSRTRLKWLSSSSKIFIYIAAVSYWVPILYQELLTPLGYVMSGTDKILDFLKLRDDCK